MTKLNYDVKMPEKTEEEKTQGFEAKNRTKLSMQATVGQALAAKMPQAGGGGMSMPQQTSGWGRTN